MDEDGSDERPFTVASVAETRKARFLYNKRKKVAYGLIIQHVSEPTRHEFISNRYRQNGTAAWDYLISTCKRAMDRAELRRLGKQSDALEILAGVGISANSLKIFAEAQEIRHLASKFPAANAKDETDMTEKFLEVLFNTSSIFYESAHREFNSIMTSWRFIHAPGTPHAGDRNF